MTFPPNKSVGHYTVVSPLGKGGMGEVWLARDSRLDRFAAIKFLKAEFSSDQDKLARFMQEAKAASALNHPNILTVYEIGNHENSHFIVTEYIEGQVVSDYIESEKPDLAGILDIAIQIVSALSAAHEAGIVHRDIKPGNIMVRADRIAKILDFGLAKLSPRQSPDNANSEAETMARVETLPGMLMGTPSYMSPEQARAQVLDERSDIFSFGVVLHEMITGKRVFDGESFADVIGSVLKEDAPPLASLVDRVPDELDTIIGKTLRKDREKRYQSSKDLLVDLKELNESLKFEEKLSNSRNSFINSDIHGTSANRDRETLIVEPVKNTTGYKPLILLGLLLLPVTIAAFYYWPFGAKTSVESSFTSGAGLKIVDAVSWNSAPGELFSVGRFSPDSKMIAFASTRPGSKDIWIKQTTEGSSVQITKDSFSNKDPIWSPNGNEIAYFSDRGNNTSDQKNLTGIWRIPALGGTPTSIGAIEDGSSQLRFWSSAGLIYYESGHNLYAMDSKTGASKAITQFADKDKKTRWFAVSRNEKKIGFVTNNGNRRRISAMPIEGGAPFLVADVDNEIGGLVWHPENNALFFSTLVDGTYQIFLVDSDGGAPVQITSGDRNSLVVDVSLDGSSILFGSAKEDSNLWRTDVDTGKEEAFVAGIDAELWPHSSPTGKKVVFQSVKNLSQGNNIFNASILVKNAETDESPTKIAENGFLPVWAPDGSKLAYLQIGTNSAVDLKIVDTSGGSASTLVRSEITQIGYSLSPYNRVQAYDFDWSPDSSSIAYISNRKGLSNLSVVAVDGSGNKLITDNRVKTVYYYCPTWSSDGKSLAYYSKSNSAARNGKSIYRFWVYDAETDSSKSLYETTRLSRLIGWSESDRALHIASTDTFSSLPPKTILSLISTADGSIRESAILNQAYFYNIHVSPGGKRIGFAANRDGKDDIWIVPAEKGAGKRVTNNNDPNLYFSSLAWSADGKSIFFGKQNRFSLLSIITNVPQGAPDERSD